MPIFGAPARKAAEPRVKRTVLAGEAGYKRGARALLRAGDQAAVRAGLGLD